MDPSSIIKGIRYHAPRIRPLDSAIGAGVGALGGLATAGIRDAMGDDEEKDNARYWTHGLAGAGLGFGAANLVGDRARRYIANNVAPFGYDGRYGGSEDYQTAATEAGLPKGTEPSQQAFLKPRSWAHFYNTAIADRPSEVTRNFMTHKKGPNLSEFSADSRNELLRRHMGLPVRDEDAIFKSTGRRWFQPRVSHTGNVISGGIPGNYEHVELHPQALARYKTKGLDKVINETGRHLTTPAQIAETRQETVYPEVDKPVGPFWNPNSRTEKRPSAEPVTRQVSTGNMVDNPEFKKLKEDPWASVFARHGTQLDPKTQTARVFDHWDFGLQPLENQLLREYMQGAMTGGNLDEEIPYDVRQNWEKQQIADWFGAGKDGPAATKKDHMMGLLKRVFLNDALGQGGVVFDQEFDFSDPKQPKPIYFNPNQTDVGLKYLQDRKPGG